MLRHRYKELSQFSGNLATSLEAGVRLPDAVRTTGRTLRAAKVKVDPDDVLDAISNGADLATALSPPGSRWPQFYIPIIKAGEQTGRLDEALRYLEEHCRLIQRPAESIFNAWFLPLAIIFVGSAVKPFLVLFVVGIGLALDMLGAQLVDYATLLFVILLIGSPLTRPFVDQIRMRIPFLGAVEREIGVNRFFLVLHLVYQSGGYRVEDMIRLAARCVPNLALRWDLLQAADEVEAGKSIPDAFSKPQFLTATERDAIETGDLSGTLDRSLERIAREAGERLQFRLEMVNRFSFRIVVCLVMLSTTRTVISLAYAVFGRSA